MKKFIAAAVAVAVTVPAVPAQAATLTQYTDQYNNPHCRISLNDAEKGPANQAEQAARTLTRGAMAVAYTEAIETTFPGVKAVGDDYVRDHNVHLFLTHERASRQEPADVTDGRKAARAAAKAKLAPLGLRDDDADLYLDNKEGQQNPENGGRRELITYANWYMGIEGGANPISKLHPNHVPGNFGKTEAVNLKFVSNEKRDAFAYNLNQTYFGKVINVLESSYVGVFQASRGCYEGVTHVMFPSAKLPLPELVTYRNTILDPKPAPAPAPAPAPKPELPDVGALSSENGAPNIGAIIALVIGIIATIGGLLNGLPNLPNLPR